jgi:hypothetical protein
MSDVSEFSAIPGIRAITDAYVFTCEFIPAIPVPLLYSWPQDILLLSKWWPLYVNASPLVLSTAKHVTQCSTSLTTSLRMSPLLNTPRWQKIKWDT